MSNPLFQAISTTGPGSGLALRETKNINLSTIVSVPFSYTFNNTPTSTLDTGARIPSGALILYVTIQSPAASPILPTSVNIAVGISNSASGPITKSIHGASSATSYAIGIISGNSIVASTSETVVVLTTTTSAAASGILKGVIYYTPSLALV
jgi:hypothetical protein